LKIVERRGVQIGCDGDNAILTRNSASGRADSLSQDLAQRAKSLSYKSANFKIETVCGTVSLAWRGDSQASRLQQSARMRIHQGHELRGAFRTTQQANATDLASAARAIDRGLDIAPTQPGLRAAIGIRTDTRVAVPQERPQDIRRENRMQSGGDIYRHGQGRTLHHPTRNQCCHPAGSRPRSPRALQARRLVPAPNDRDRSL
jgi:hypothetical protein